MAAPEFLNVDLEIESKFDLTVLKDALGRRVYDLGPGPVSLECILLRLETSRQHKTPDATILAFCSWLEKLPPKAQRARRAAHKKEFDVGHDVARGRHDSTFSLRNETLRRLSALGATLGITIYNLADSESVAPQLGGRKGKTDPPGKKKRGRKRTTPLS